MQTCAASRYAMLETERTAVLDRARAAAKLTIPTLMRPSGANENSSLPTPYQGIGARGVRNLASKLLLTLLPPNTPCFRLTLDDFTLAELAQDAEARGKFEEAMSSMERTVQHEMEATHVRVPLFEALMQLVVSGNVLLYVDPDLKTRTYRLDRYVVQRDAAGNVLEVVVKEDMAPIMLPESVQALLTENPEGGHKRPEKSVPLYTYIYREGSRWKVRQQVDKIPIPDSEGSYPADQCPWLPLRFTQIDGENYGRSYVEEYIGDLRSLEGLTQAIVEGSAALSKILFLVRPNGTTSPKTLAESPNGAIRSGAAEDVTVVQAQKQADFSVALQTMQAIEKRMEYAFLLTSSIQRAGERVTAEEIRRMAADLEASLGGVYSLLTTELQLPLVRLFMTRMTKQKRLPRLPEKHVRPTVVGGIEALGRGNDLTRLQSLVEVMAPLGDAFFTRLNMDEMIRRVAASLQIEPRGLVKTEEQIAQEQQQAQMQQMMQQITPEVVRGASAQQIEQMRQQAPQQGTA
ncbi:portal protein [Roseomonas sp. GC11]|uniref:portal protein n=1 Tax=Roseomonas sp. GC11 TaxID=2950546 RepID=UPI00210A5C52|nr:portal protein [Roseomonas sp. GC11]MCQ4158764.1 portal protein [Roseomonas sp. GC11]